MSDCNDTTEFPHDTMPAIRRVMRPQDTNALGSIFGGVILSEIDLAAAITAHRLHPERIVTVAMDKVEFKQPVFVGDLLSLFGKVTRVGRSSITVDISVWAERRLSGYNCCHVTQATVTMVAVDEEYKPVAVAHPEKIDQE
jgi:acyl-CoA thioesterase YciA